MPPLCPNSYGFSMKLSLTLLFLLLPLSLLVGSVSLSPAEVWNALYDPTSDPTARFIIVESRLPQMLAALLAGMALSVSGLVMQTLFGNPLADPSLLGVNTGARSAQPLPCWPSAVAWRVGPLRYRALCLQWPPRLQVLLSSLHCWDYAAIIWAERCSYLSAAS